MVYPTDTAHVRVYDSSMSQTSATHTHRRRETHRTEDMMGRERCVRI